MAKRQVVILKSVDPADDDGGGMPSLGDLKDVLDQLARYNTTPDGSKPRPGADTSVMVLFGPGMIVELSPQDDEVKQLMVTMTDEDFAFPVLTRASRAFKWTMMDPESGQRLRFG